MDRPFLFTILVFGSLVLTEGSHWTRTPSFESGGDWRHLLRFSRKPAAFNGISGNGRASGYESKWTPVHLKQSVYAEVNDPDCLKEPEDEELEFGNEKFYQRGKVNKKKCEESSSTSSDAPLKYQYPTRRSFQTLQKAPTVASYQQYDQYEETTTLGYRKSAYFHPGTTRKYFFPPTSTVQGTYVQPTPKPYYPPVTQAPSWKYYTTSELSNSYDQFSTSTQFKYLDSSTKGYYEPTEATYRTTSAPDQTGYVRVTESQGTRKPDGTTQKFKDHDKYTHFPTTTEAYFNFPTTGYGQENDETTPEYSTTVTSTPEKTPTTTDFYDDDYQDPKFDSQTASGSSVATKPLQIAAILVIIVNMTSYFL